MNKTDRITKIKQMSRGLTSSELSELSSYFKKRAGERYKYERLHSIIDLGIGGRVVFASYSPNPDIDVTGKVGTIKKINKRKDRYYLTVEFDEDVWTSKRTVDTKEFAEWFASLSVEDRERIREEYPKLQGMRRYRQYYRKHMGKNSTEEKIISGNTLVRIPPTSLRPATEKNIREAQSNKRVNDALNKILSGEQQ